MDIENNNIIKKNINNLENYNFEEIIKKYNLQNEIILIITKSNSLIKYFQDKFGKIIYLQIIFIFRCIDDEEQIIKLFLIKKILKISEIVK